MEINLDNKTFTSLSNSENGEVTKETVFQYHQEGSLIWAEYSGGEIVKGFLLGKSENGELNFGYQHMNILGELITGECTSIPEINEDGKIILHESWQWTCKDYSTGKSTLIEV